MNFAGVFTRILAPIMAVLNAAVAFVRGRGSADTTKDGYHVSRDGRVQYKSRSMRSYERKMHRWGRRTGMRTGGPILTGARLLRVAKSCCPANLIVCRKACLCGQHGGPVLVRVDMATRERIEEIRARNLTAAERVKAYEGLPSEAIRAAEGYTGPYIVESA